jgi:hypothetical protein
MKGSSKAHRKTEVSNLEGTRVRIWNVQENVFWFYVQVQHSSFVDVGEPSCNLSKDTNPRTPHLVGSLFQHPSMLALDVQAKKSEDEKIN